MSNLSCDPDHEKVRKGDPYEIDLFHIFPSIGHDLVKGKQNVKVTFLNASTANSGVAVATGMGDAIENKKIKCENVKIDDDAEGRFKVKIECAFLVGGNSVDLALEQEDAFEVERT